MLPLGVFGDVDYSALGQQQVHVGGHVFGTLITLHKEQNVVRVRGEKKERYISKEHPLRKMRKCSISLVACCPV